MIVDDDWNVTCLIDLEWICARSAHMIDISYWITSRSIDEVADTEEPENLHKEYNEAREHFLSLFKEEEAKDFNGVHLSAALDRAYSAGATWFFRALDSVNAMYLLFECQIRPQFVTESLHHIVDGYFAAFWSQNAIKITKRKLQEMEGIICDSEPCSRLGRWRQNQ